MTRALLSLGSNMGDPWAYLRGAVDLFGDAVVRVSSVYRTPPWGPVAQDDFLNIAVLVTDAGAGAGDWLERCHDAERAARRERLVHWGPRTLDADVVAVWRDGGTAVLSNDPVLTLPHPRAAERAFVLVPWAEIEPEAELPGRGSIRELLAALDVSQIVRLGALRQATGGGPARDSR